jgi:hypothetical protein
MLFSFFFVQPSTQSSKLHDGPCGLQLSPISVITESPSPETPSLSYPPSTTDSSSETRNNSNTDCKTTTMTTTTVIDGKLLKGVSFFLLFFLLSFCFSYYDNYLDHLDHHIDGYDYHDSNSSNSSNSTSTSTSNGNSSSSTGSRRNMSRAAGMFFFSPFSPFLLHTNVYFRFVYLRMAMVETVAAAAGARDATCLEPLVSFFFSFFFLFYYAVYFRFVYLRVLGYFFFSIIYIYNYTNESLKVTIRTNGDVRHGKEGR